MILTCPSCATRFFLEEGRLPPAGRKVRCSACGHTWRTEAASAPVAPPDPPAPMAIEDVLIEEQVEVQEAFAPEPAEAAPADPAPVEPAPPAAAPPPLPPTFDDAFSAGRLASRSRGRHSRIARKDAEAQIMIVLLVGGIVLLLIAVITLQDPIIRAWPDAAGVYAALGLR